MIDNPYAFPSGQDHPDFSGMTLRDYFAAAALPGIITAGIAKYGLYRRENGLLDCDIGNGEFSEWAYRIADVMLAERAR